MLKKFSLAYFIVLTLVSIVYAGNCPPGSLVINPNPIAGGGSCIIEADSEWLNLNEVWSRQVNLQAGQSYWFTASKCARAYTVAGEVKDELGKVLKSDSGSVVSFCFQAPKTGMYTVSYRVTSLKGSYSYAVTKACLEKSNCKP